MPQATPERMRAAILRWWTTTYKAGQSITGAEAAALKETLASLSVPELTTKYQEVMGADPVGRHLYDPSGADAYDRIDADNAQRMTTADIQTSMGVGGAPPDDVQFRNFRPPAPAQPTGTVFNPEETLTPPEPPGFVTAVTDAVGGAGNAVMGALSAPFNPPTASAAPARTIGGYAPGDLVPNQFNRQENQLSAAEAAAACGPAAAIAFARAHGRNPTWSEAADLARQSGWTANGMGGPQNQSALLTRMGIPHEYVGGGTNWERVKQEVQAGNPVTISTGAHYFVAVDYDPASGRFDFGQSGVQSAQRNRYLAPGQIQGTNGTLYTQVPATTSAQDLNTPTPDASVLSSDAPTPTGTPTPTPTGTPTPGPAQPPGPIDNSSPARFTATALPYAQQVQAETGIPASIMVAIAANETGYGRSVAGNNYFGIKGSNPTTGANTGPVPTWEVVNGQRTNTRDTFRAYDNPAESFQDFAQFLRDNPRYANALQQTGNPEAFIRAVHAAGYATDPNWSTQVLSIARQVNGTGDVDMGVGGTVATRPPGPTTSSAPWMPPLPQGGLPSPQDAMGYAADVIAAAEAAASAAEARIDPNTDPEGKRAAAAREQIMASATARIRTLAGFMEMGQKDGYENANRRLLEARLSLDQTLGMGNLALGRDTLTLNAELGRERNRIDAATLAQRAKEATQRYGLDIVKLVIDDAWTELEFGLKERGVNTEEYRANLEGFGMGLRQWELENGSYGDRSQAAIGAFSASNQAELGAFNANQGVEAERRKLLSEYAQQVAMAGLGMRQEQARAQNLRNEAAPWALPDGAQFIPGFEPGGVAQQLAGMFGATAPVMDRSWTTQVNPEAGLQQLAAANQQSLAQHPGNPANLAANPAARIELDRLNGPSMPTPGGGPNFTLPVIQPPRGAGSPTRTMREQLLQMLMGGQ